MNILRRLKYISLGAALLGGLLAQPLAAQLPGIGFGGSIGANLPQGRFSDGAKTGLVANGIVELRASPMFALRGELLWSRSDLDNPLIRKVGDAVLPSGSLANVSGNVDMIGGIANVVVSLSSSVIQPYLIGGYGVYRRRVAQDISGTTSEFSSLRASDTNRGYNVGAGLRIGLAGLTVFAEARYHSVNTSPDRTTFIPVTVGLVF